MTAPARGGVRDFTALGFDPAPGELPAVQASAEQYRKVGTRLAAALRAIESIIDQTGVWEGEASEAFARRVGDLPEYLGKAAESMKQASTALDDWAGALGDLQQRAVELEARARQAREAAEAARANPAFDLTGQTFTDPAALEAANRALDQAARQLTAAIDQLEAVLEAARRLREQHHELAARIAELLDRAREIAPDEPGMLAKGLEALGDAVTELANDTLDLARDALRTVTDFIEDNANLIANVSDVISDLSTMIGAVGDVLNVVPVVGQVADQALNVVSGTLGAVALTGHVVAKAAGGDVPDETIALDVIGLVTTPVPGAGLGMLAGQGIGEAATGGEASTIYDNLRQYWVPRDLRQGVQGAVSPASVAFENAIRDGIEEDNAGQAERDRRRAEERVWQ
ncbi:hypothetical protein SAMN05421810_105285 [Amycolatopsis arida]|uniref:Putative T7SS secretion signal domain-containing protein n=1 Tax=Amycolatopsis arida TaxID=587909 RepID=A0A1I5WUM1_9PSEU|nr:hypothetical protein [Amycolatopsis arida]TDX92459.1 hypothetical protein CLV69_105304 [Amycolatopsis arida]SFQ23399.1 hypothetical protein SAMN05421810_105285 [Amycolatopsis arida]